MTAAAAALALGAGPALAVGLSPLVKAGDTASPAKAFYLTITNPYPQPRAFRAYVDGLAEAEQATDLVDIHPAKLTIKGGGDRRIMVILRGLAPGETREARVCAQLAQSEGMIHARVCSKLSARRPARRG